VRKDTTQYSPQNQSCPFVLQLPIDDPNAAKS
jgi:hypothetical protein